MTFRLSPSTSLATGDLSSGRILPLGSPRAQVVNSESLPCVRDTVPQTRKTLSGFGTASQVNRRDGNRGLASCGHANGYRPWPKQHLATKQKWPLDCVEAIYRCRSNTLGSHILDGLTVPLRSQAGLDMDLRGMAEEMRLRAA